MALLDLGDPTTLTLRTDMNTPAEHRQYEGVKLTVPEGVPLPTPGEFSELRAFGVTVHGYVRNTPTGPEWLIGPTPDPSLVKVDAIPGPSGWADQGGRQTFLGQGNYLLGEGIGAEVLWPGLANFYNATVADLVAKGWTAPD